MKKRYEVKLLCDGDYDEVKLTKALEVYGMWVYSVKPINEKRSESQNSTLHGWLDVVAEQSKELGLTIGALYKEPSEVEITKDILKQYTKQVSEFMFDEQKTSSLNTKQFSSFIENLERLFAQKIDNTIPFNYKSKE